MPCVAQGVIRPTSRAPRKSGPPGAGCTDCLPGPRRQKMAGTMPAGARRSEWSKTTADDHRERGLSKCNSACRTAGGLVRPGAAPREFRGENGTDWQTGSPTGFRIKAGFGGQFAGKTTRRDNHAWRQAAPGIEPTARSVWMPRNLVNVRPRWVSRDVAGPNNTGRAAECKKATTDRVERAPCHGWVKAKTTTPIAARPAKHSNRACPFTVRHRDAEADQEFQGRARRAPMGMRSSGAAMNSQRDGRRDHTQPLNRTPECGTPQVKRRRAWPHGSRASGHACPRQAAATPTLQDGCGYRIKRSP